MKTKKILSIILSLVMVLAMVTGCSKDSSNSSATVDETQYFNTYITAEPTTFDSAMATDTYAIGLLTNMMEPLLRLEQKADGTVESKPAGAESYDVSEDQTVWTFHLRDNNWSDGKPVTAQDYEYGIKRVLDPNVGAAYSYIMMPIKNAEAVNLGEKSLEDLGVKALDEKTLEITLESPTSYFLGLVYHTVMLPQRQDIVEQYGDQYGTAVDKMVYNGPFKCDKWIHNSELELVKNDQYWDKDSVKLATINYKIIQDENAIYNSLENNSIDTALTSNKEWTDTFKGFDELNYIQNPNATVYYQYYNQTDELFSNANVRKAFTLAIDREALNKAIYDGLYTPAYGVVPPTVAINETEYRSVASSPIKKLQEENEDPKALLIKGLEELGMDTDTSKLSVEMQLGGTDQWTKTLAEYMQQTYKEKLGVNLEIKMLDWGVFMTNYYNFDYQIGQMSFGADFDDPLSMLSCLDSNQDGFCIGYGNEKIDELIKQATAETDTDKKVAMIEEIEDIFLVQDACIAPITYSTSNVFTYKYVEDYIVSNFATNGYKYTYTKGRSNK